RASLLFDTVVVAAMRNPQKASALFNLEERKELIEMAVGHRSNIEIVGLSSLVVQLAREIGASVIIRGLRAVSDFENELQMAQMNRQLSGIDTLFIPTSSIYSFVASRLLREVALYGGDVSGFVPAPIASAIAAKFN
ncbi:MAG: pantetheine-phosphate adenylyltransferase, partial [Actinomycetota bacterium]|nr:pantetheine-phosphate adenylyltransferase [Actinomycetota bacterium]